MEKEYAYYLDKQILAEQLRRERELVVQKASDMEEALAIVRRADESLAKIEQILAEMSALAVKAASLNAEGRDDLNRQFQALKEVLNQSVAEADLGGYNLLDGSLGELQSALKTIEDVLNLK